MLLEQIYLFILRRPFFRGQDRIFNYLFKKNKLSKEWHTVRPIQGNFKITCDASTWIGAKIIYTGNYEPALKNVAKKIIRKGDYVLDIGANIGFHTLYFAELVGDTGHITSFEPVPYNFKTLINNVRLNSLKNISAKNIALGIKNEQITIVADEKSANPGTFNLFDQSGSTLITCCIGDEVIGDQRVDFIKIDVEGYESFVIEGILDTIKKNRPIIIFEYDIHYHKKTGLTKDHIFLLLSPLNYHFEYITQFGRVVLDNFDQLKSGNILAIPND